MPLFFIQIMKKVIYLVLLFIYQINTQAQGSFPPNASSIGTTAIHKDSLIFTNWATNCSVERGWQNILDPTLGKATAGNENNGIGQPQINGTVSLGDSGQAIITFEDPIFNGLGNDFAIFENSFNDKFLELAFVEVSTDGIDYVRFPSFSETQDTLQTDGFGETDATNIHNLAGKYRTSFGTPFDLEELIDSSKIDVNDINYIKIIDVIGIINNTKTSFDQNQNQINDPFPTPFPSSGFDLDAVGVIHQLVTINEKVKLKTKLYPNPSNGNFTLQFNNTKEKTISLINVTGNVISIINTDQNQIKINENLKPGIYYVKTNIENTVLIDKIIIL